MDCSQRKGSLAMHGLPKPIERASEPGRSLESVVSLIRFPLVSVSHLSCAISPGMDCALSSHTTWAESISPVREIHVYFIVLWLVNEQIKRACEQLGRRRRRRRRRTDIFKVQLDSCCRPEGNGEGSVDPLKHVLHVAPLHQPGELRLPYRI